MNYQLGRVKLLTQTQVELAPVFDVAFIGHTRKQAKLSVLFNNPVMLNDLRNVGYGALLDDLKKKLVAENSADPLFNLPIPLRNFSDFNQLFCVDIPNDQGYQTRLTGKDVWLPMAIADFFQSDVMNIPRRLWIIPVDEQKNVSAFLTYDAVTIPREEEDNALLRALSLPDLAYLAMPDFERLLIPQSITPIPLLRLVNPIPNFLPCSNSGDDGVKERSTDTLPYELDETDNFVSYLKLILRLIENFRPDINLLITFPYDEQMDGELPKISLTNLEAVNRWRKDFDRQLLKRAQLLYPFLQDADGQLSSPTGVIAGKILASSSARGTWRSAAGEALSTYKRPFPNLSNKAVFNLREKNGLGVFQFINGKLQLDDERLAVNYFDDEPASNSAELSRFMGWLIRSLEKLGFGLVFESTQAVTKSEILLQSFLGRLYAMGALRGKNSEEAFSVSASSDGDASVIIEIAIAPAFAIDTITLDFRYENGSLKNWEASNG